MKEIQLTQGKIALEDDEDYERLSMFRWCYDKSTGYAVRNIYPVDGHHPVKLYMHRVIMETPKDGHLVTDHINQNRLDNRSLNLRIVNRSTNRKNSVKYRAAV